MIAWARRLGPAGTLGLTLSSVFFAVALLGPAMAPHSPVEPALDFALAEPSGRFWLGADENGIDLFSMLLHGARLSFTIATFTCLVSAAVGASVGSWAGTVGGAFDQVAMRIVDVVLSFPGLVLNLAVVALVAQPKVHHLIFALCLTGWAGYARLARGLAVAMRPLEFMQAARVAGAGPTWLVWRHVLPNLAGPLLVQATFGFGGAILAEASLSFLGLGPALPYSWGALLAQGTAYLWRSAHMAAVPGVALAAVLLGCNLLGDALAARLDPRSRTGNIDFKARSAYPIPARGSVEDRRSP